MSPYPLPLRTARDSFPSSRSSLVRLNEFPASMDMLVARLMKVNKVFSLVSSSIFDAYPMMAL